MRFFLETYLLRVHAGGILCGVTTSFSLCRLIGHHISLLTLRPSEERFPPCLMK